MNEWDEFLENAKCILDKLAKVNSNAHLYDVLHCSPQITQRQKDLQTMPKTPTPLAEVIKETLAMIKQGYCNVAHPQHYGYFSPRPLPTGILGDIIASTLNQSAAAWRSGPTATVIECETLKWIADFIGYDNPTNSKIPNGVFTSGGSVANLTALKLARDSKLENVQSKGLQATSTPSKIYMSNEGHFSIAKAVDVLGLGKDSLQLVPVNACGQIDIDALKAILAQDKEAGYKPLCLIAMAGNSAMGAIDPLDKLATIAKEHSMWFHIDGAAGSCFANLSSTKKHFNGLSLADSITIDPHKWFFMPWGIGCLLVKEGKELIDSFKHTGHYWAESEELDTMHMNIAGARFWKSLGLWLTFQHLGAEGLQQLLLKNLEITQHLAQKISKHKQLELLQDPVLPVCCFRICKASKEPDLNELNTKIQQNLIAKGSHFFTLIHWNSKVYFRVGINNYNAQKEHVDILLNDIFANKYFPK